MILRLPTALAPLANTVAATLSGRRAHRLEFALSVPVAFSYHAEVWAAQVATGAVAYEISFDATKNRWYLDASWSGPAVPAPSLAALGASRTLGVDLNADHLACWVISPDGNPIGCAHRIELALTGSSSQRDGRLRQAITELLNYAQAMGCASITVENLDFADARRAGRETMGMGRRGKTFRRTVSGIPTAKFRDRLSGMAANQGIWVIAVDPAYTSRWGGEHWMRPLTTQSKQATHANISSTTKSSSSLPIITDRRVVSLPSSSRTTGKKAAALPSRAASTGKTTTSPPPPEVTRHSCAAVVIGRRGKQHRARNTARYRSTYAGHVDASVSTPDVGRQRMASGQPVPTTDSTVDPTPGTTGTGKGSGQSVRKTLLREPDRPVDVEHDGTVTPRASRRSAPVHVDVPLPSAGARTDRNRLVCP